MPWKPPKHQPPRAFSKQKERAQYDRDRRKEKPYLYSQPRWRALRAVMLQRHPICQECGTMPAEHVDHVVTVRERPDLAFEESNLRCLCAPCHSRATCKHDGGFGRATKGGKPSSGDAG